MKKTLSIFASGLFALAFILGAPVAEAQVGDYPPGTLATSTVGAPNTGAGGDAMKNVAILVTTGLIAVGGAALLLRDKRAA